MAAARLSPLLACLPHALAAVGGDAIDAGASFVDDARRSTRTWPRCNFQSIRDDSIDQFVFTLFGGRLDDWQRDFMAPDGCDVWARPSSRRSCACTAPLELVGSGTFVEIGANDGLHMSNSWFFERHLGWRGMCVSALLRAVVYIAHVTCACTRVQYSRERAARRARRRARQGQPRATAASTSRHNQPVITHM